MSRELFPWPLLNKELEKGTLQEVDLHFAKDVLQSFKEAKEKDAAVLCSLMHATRNGHLCLYVDRQNLESLFPDEDQKELIDLIVQGIENPLPGLFIAKEEDRDSFAYPVYRVDNRLYFQRYWQCEQKILNTISGLNKKTPHFLPENLFHPSLTSEQQNAINEVLSNSLTFLTGGPGTGKTYTSFYIAKTLFEMCSEEEKKNFSIILTAPTGKATEQLKKNFRSFIESGVNVEAATLHHLLGVRKNIPLHTITAHIHASLIIIDECSMIDADLFSCLIKALSEDAKIVFMGDPNQLPAVGMGSVFNDLLDRAKISQAFGMAHLSKCLRSDREEILSLAYAVKEGLVEKAYEKLQNSTEHLKKIELGFDTSSASYILHNLLRHVDKEFVYKTDSDKDPLSLIHKCDKIKILSCLRKGPLGVDAINDYLKQHFRKKASGSEFWIAPIMIAENDKEFSLSNGQSGIILYPLKNQNLKPKAFFIDHESHTGYKTLPVCLLPKFEYAYCISVHKSQGSEYDHVVFLAPKGSEAFGKEVLYTALTRAKNLLEIDMDKEVFFKTLQTNTKRFSGICAFSS